MRHSIISQRGRGFTLMETVIAIGVLALLMTGFIAVFAPAATGIRNAISVQEADRLAFALEKELTDLRGDTSEFDTGFEKAYEWIKDSGGASGTPLFVYQYRAVIDGSLRSDGTLAAFQGSEGVAGQDFIVQAIVRQKGDPLLEEDLDALEGRVYCARLIQLVFRNNQMERVSETGGEIEPPKGGLGGQTVDEYPEAVIAFAAEFHSTPNSSYQFLDSNFDLSDLDTPMFTRNLAVRR